MGIIYLPQFGNLSNSSNANKMLVFITILIVNACIAGTIPATPENITVTFLTPTTVRVSWQTMIDLNAHPVEKYIVTYKPTDDRVVQDVAGNSEAIILDRLSPSTQYSIAVTAIWLGKKYRSRQIIFRTLDMPKPSSQQDYLTGGGGVFNNAAGGHGDGVNLSSGGLAGGAAPAGSGGASGRRATNGSIFGDDVTSTATNTLPHGTHRELPTIRGVEIGIVLIVLMVWAGAIALFFNRWGKIRMLLPYQPDYKHEQLKVPGTGVCSSGTCNGQHSHQHFHMLQEESTVIAERCTRSRINSAIFVSSEGRGFDSIEFLRRHGSQSVLCRKARSAENITDNGRKKSFSDKRQWHEEDVETDGHNDADVYAKDDNANNFIELQERRRPSNEMRTLSVLQANIGSSQYNGEQTSTTIAGIATSVLGGCHSAAVTTSTSNMVVGSISIEAPPAYIKEDLQHQHQLQLQLQPSIASNNSTSHDSTDTVEELILIPTAPEATRSRVLVHQRSSTSSHTNRSQSPALSSTHSSPKALSRKGVKPKIGTLPMVSVSRPSPPHEKQPLPPPPSECL